MNRFSVEINLMAFTILTRAYREMTAALPMDVISGLARRTLDKHHLNDDFSQLPLTPRRAR